MVPDTFSCSRYCRERLGHRSDWTLLAFAFWPPTFFFRMAYTESMFIFLAILALWAMQRQWNLFAIAIVIGVATATRSVGVALLVPFAIHIWRSSLTWRRAMLAAVVILPLATWGLCAFAAYQHFEFGDALAFAKAQDNYRIRAPIGLGVKAIKLSILEPIWANYLPGTDAWWGSFNWRFEPNLLFSLRFWNPIYFVGTIVLIALGWRKKWLNAYELGLAAALILIPYVTRGYDFGMCSQARFSAVCFPVYLVMGRILAALPMTWRVGLLGLSTFYLAAFSILFSLGYPIF